MGDAELYDLIQSLWGGLAQAAGVLRARAGEQTEPPPLLLQLRGGLAESPGWFMVQAAEFDPEPLTVAALRVRDVYASERLVAALLELMATEKWFDRQGEAYHLTKTGRKIARRLQQRMAILGELDVSAYGADLARLEGLLRRLIEASLQSEEPPGAWCLARSRQRAPAEDSSNGEKVYQYVADINAFRDDVHMAAWRPLEVAGYVWEAFSLVCAGQAKTAVALYDQLAYRGYSRSDYAAALETLQARGWLEPETATSYFVTPAGQAVRDDVEHATNSYFYKPWWVLSKAELAELKSVLVRLRDGLPTLS